MNRTLTAGHSSKVSIPATVWILTLLNFVMKLLLAPGFPALRRLCPYAPGEGLDIREAVLAAARTRKPIAVLQTDLQDAIEALRLFQVP